MPMYLIFPWMLSYVAKLSKEMFCFVVWSTEEKSCIFDFSIKFNFMTNEIMRLIKIQYTKKDWYNFLRNSDAYEVNGWIMEL